MGIFTKLDEVTRKNDPCSNMPISITRMPRPQRGSGRQDALLQPAPDELIEIIRGWYFRRNLSDHP
jgi:hypothetical protein